MEFDSRLRALADCAVIPYYATQKQRKKNRDLMGGITFNPYPSIVAASDVVLSHEVCHRIAGKKDFDIFLTAIVSNPNPAFKFVLNLIYDWYHEVKYEAYSPFLKQKVSDLHEISRSVEPPKSMQKVKELMFLMRLYFIRDETPESVGIRDCHDLVYIAEKMFKRVKGQLSKKAMGQLQADCEGFGQAIAEEGGTGAGSASYGTLPKFSNYYAKAVGKYGGIIRILAEMWTRNKYAWVHKHYGEIDWKNLIKVYMGEKLEWPVFLILAKVLLIKNMHLVIDRSGSTDGQLKYDIMDTAIIIAESLRQCKTPVSIVDVGVQDKVINKIDQPVDTRWFTPTADGGTPLGAVCSTIVETDPESMLLIITDGQPDDWDTLASAIKRFPGTNLNFVIGNDYPKYATRIGNSLSVEPHTMIKELMHYAEKGGQL